MTILFILFFIAALSGFPLERDRTIHNISRSEDMIMISQTNGTDEIFNHSLGPQKEQNITTFQQKCAKNHDLISNEPCGLEFDLVDIERAKNKIRTDMLNDEVFLFFFYLKPKAEFYYKHLLDKKEVYWNGIQEWVWFKKEYKYYVSNLPVDLDALTFTISHYGSKNIEIRWTLTGNCNQTAIINYEKETKRIRDYLRCQVIGNETWIESHLCHRNFVRDERFLDLLYKVLTIWIGYDFDCYSTNSFENDMPIEESKNTIIKILLVVVGVLGYMYPLLFRLVETLQPTKHYEDVFCYYKDKIEIEKPYSITRCCKKFFFGNGTTYDDAKDNMCLKYIPIVRMLLFIELIMIGFNVYLELKVTNEFRECGTENFPDVYRKGTIEYNVFVQFLIVDLSLPNFKFKRICFVLSSAFLFFVSSLWIYVSYNEKKDVSIFCIPVVRLCCCTIGTEEEDKLTFFTHMKKIVKWNEKNDNYELLTVGKKLILRFTLLFKRDLWHFVLKNSFGCIWCKPDEHCKNCLSCLCYLCGVFVFLVNLVSVLISSIPPFNLMLGIWFCSCKAKSKSENNPASNTSTVSVNRSETGRPENQIVETNGSNEEDQSDFGCCTDCSMPGFKTIQWLGNILFFFSYGLLLREHIYIFVFILRAFFHTILIGFIGPEYIFRKYIVVFGALAYFLGYFTTFVDSYKNILDFIFEEINKEEHQNKSLAYKTRKTNFNKSISDHHKQKNNLSFSNISDYRQEKNDIHQKIVDLKKERADLKDELLEWKFSEKKIEILTYLQEKIFNYIVDNCFTVQQRIVILIFKTGLTLVFFYVTFVVLEDSGVLLQTNHISDFISYFAVLLSPQIVKLLFQAPSDKFIKSHKLELIDLYHEATDHCKSTQAERDTDKRMGCCECCCKCCSKCCKCCCKCCSKCCSKCCECFHCSSYLFVICFCCFLTSNHFKQKNCDLCLCCDCCHRCSCCKRDKTDACENIPLETADTNS